MDRVRIFPPDPHPPGPLRHRAGSPRHSGESNWIWQVPGPPVLLSGVAGAIIGAHPPLQADERERLKAEFARLGSSMLGAADEDPIEEEEEEEEELERRPSALFKFGRPLLDPEDDSHDFVPKKKARKRKPIIMPDAPPAADVSDPALAAKLMKAAGRPTRPPTVFYCTRTHGQVSQIVHELANTAYRPRMACLASREHTCINRKLNKSRSKSADCKELLKTGKCKFFRGSKSLAFNPRFQPGGVNEVWDIEDVVKVGRASAQCPYYAARLMAESAALVICPYNYLLDPKVRKAMGITVKGSIVVLDEAHNIEDASRECAGADLSLRDLDIALGELSPRSKTDPGCEVALYVVDTLAVWIRSQEEGTFRDVSPEQQARTYTGIQVAQLWQPIGLTTSSWPSMESEIRLLLSREDEEQESLDSLPLNAKTATVLDDVVMALGFLLGDRGERLADYRLAGAVFPPLCFTLPVVKQLVREGRGGGRRWEVVLSVWCMNPGVIFAPLAAEARSVLLTSGTLRSVDAGTSHTHYSPMDSFSSELQTKFPLQLEASHVIDTEKQVWISALTRGSNGTQLNTSYRSAESLQVQDAIGETLLLLCESAGRGGVLCFFPSYRLLDKMTARWGSIGLLDRLEATKTVFKEPRSREGDFDNVMGQFYSCVEASRAGGMPNGPIMFAVCRGKVSEGMDFTDDNARLVAVIGIPFPNFKNVQVEMKKQYNDSSSRGLLSGREWYSQQAYRAINQAIGRCLRHRNDYGAIALIDERFGQQGVVRRLSKWLRFSVRSFEGGPMEAAASLGKFFVANQGGAAKIDQSEQASGSRIQAAPMAGGAMTGEGGQEDGIAPPQLSDIDEDIPELLALLTKVDPPPPVFSYKRAGSALAMDDEDFDIPTPKRKGWAT